MGEVKTGAERTAASRERARKAEGYDQAIAEAARLKDLNESLILARDEALGQLRAFQQQQLTWVEQAQAAIAQRDDAISVLGQQLAQLRAQHVPLAQPAPPNPRPDENFFVTRCPRCAAPVKIPSGNNHVIARGPGEPSLSR